MLPYCIIYGSIFLSEEDMAYKALYRQFRPRRFEDLKGQELITRILRNQIIQNEPAHAYIFSGPRGTGKTSTAKIFAAALNCENPENGEPCLKCQNCIAALNDSMIDIIEMDAASNNGVDNARDIRDKAGLLPTRGRYKVYIIDEVHMLTGPAFNALLKTIEEPPEHVVFILATTELDAVPKTVLSRCLRFDFKFIDRKLVIERMKEVLRTTGMTADEDALEDIADASEGAMRDALTMLEKCCAFGVNIDSDIVASVLGRASNIVLRGFMDCYSRYDERSSILKLREILASGIESGPLAVQFTDILEKILVSVVTGEENAWSGYKDEFSKERLIRSMDIISDAQSKMRYVSRPDAVLEGAVLKTMIPMNDEKALPGGLIETIRRLEKKISELERNGIKAAPETAEEIPVRQEKRPQNKKGSPAQEVSEDAGREGEFFTYLTKELIKKDKSYAPFFSRLELIREDSSQIAVRCDNPMFRNFLSLKADDLNREMDQKFGRHKLITISSANEEKLSHTDEIVIID